MASCGEQPSRAQIGVGAPARVARRRAAQKGRRRPPESKESRLRPRPAGAPEAGAPEPLQAVVPQAALGSLDRPGRLGRLGRLGSREAA
eukprot:scaffold77533_cov36-Phaeocystis_antarctica.AAC.1